MLVTKDNVIKYPKFYIKAVGGKYSLEHRLTHTYLESFDTEEELAKGIKEWSRLNDYELWEELLYSHHVRVVNSKDYDKVFEHQEDWYFGAWGVYTTHFYMVHEELLEIVEKIPYDLINKIRKEKADEISRKRKKEAALMEKTRKELIDAEKEEKRKQQEQRAENLRKQREEREQSRRREKDAPPTKKKKIRIKRNTGTKVKVPIISSNPF